MLCIFKTPIDPHPEVPGKLMARHTAGECQKACHDQVAGCEHDPTVTHHKEGRYLLATERKQYFKGKPLTPQQETALNRSPNLRLFNDIDEIDVVVDVALDLNRREVMISPDCVKSDGTPITIEDFPDGYDFGNGMSVAVTVPIKGSDACILSWATFPDADADAVRARYDTLQQIMES